jgi:hypothetical protein
MFDINVRADMRRLTKDFDRLMQRQVPFATAMAINTVAVHVQKAEQQQIEETFDRPTPFTVKSVAVKKATKATRTATVYIRPVAAKYLAPYADGGTQTLPGTSRAVLNPKDTGLLNRYGGIPRNAIARLRGRSDVFVGTVTTKGGEQIDGVWQRPTRPKLRKRGRSKLPQRSNTTGRLKLLVRFTDPQPVKKRLPFGETAAEIINRELQPAFDKAMAAAMKTAR